MLNKFQNLISKLGISLYYSIEAFEIYEAGVNYEDKGVHKYIILKK